MRFKLQLLLKGALLLLIAMTLTSCINDNGVLRAMRSKIKVSEKIVTISVPVKGEITGINASGSMKIEYVVSNENQIRISGAENVVKEMGASFDDNNILNLEFNNSDKYKFVSDRQRIKVYIASPSARHFRASASAKIRIDSISSDTTLSFNSSSIGKIFISTVKASSVDIKSTSSGDVEIERLFSSSIDAASASIGKIEIENADAKSMNLIASSNGRISFDNVSATEITADASSTAKISLEGKAEKAAFTASSAARIFASKLKVKSGILSASSSAIINSDVTEASVNTSSSGKVKNRKR